MIVIFVAVWKKVKHLSQVWKVSWTLVKTLAHNIDQS